MSARDLLTIAGSAGGPETDAARTVDWRAFLTADAAERAIEDANAWIKALRAIEVDGRPLRDRFTYRGDSLWWFAELYLHREDVIASTWRVALALDALCARECPMSIAYRGADPPILHLLPQIAARHGVACTVARPASDSRRRRTELRSRFYTWTALASRARRWTRTPARPEGAETLAFVHSAFWRGGSSAEDTGEEGYIGPVLREWAARADAPPLRLIGVGPRTNFGARRWWHPLMGRSSPADAADILPIESFSTWAALAGSRGVWHAREAYAEALTSSEALRAHARIGPYDIWPIVRNELRGVALLQFPWSARAMDEAAAALDECRPSLIFTYAEAGGWGRALMLEARRRRIPSVGLQHGFIYRHWLNYRHEPDEMRSSCGNPEDCGFPRPDLTLVFDGQAAGHLTAAGAFPRETLHVAGSPPRDRLVQAVSAASVATKRATRAALGVPDSARLIVLVTKYVQVAAVLPALVNAVETLADVRLVIKPHPAETPDVYQPALAGRSPREGPARAHTVVAPSTATLADLLSVARLLVTVNSTVAIDALVFDLPSLVIGLPNNLSPFVEAGAMAGWTGGDEGALAETVQRLVDTDNRRQVLLADARAFAVREGIGVDGRAAGRAVDTMLALRRGARDGESPAGESPDGRARDAENRGAPVGLPL